jgi:hypothetical protein
MALSCTVYTLPKLKYIQMNKAHSFHIPVLGIGFSVDTPLKVAHLGIDSVISLGDDSLLERLRKKYCSLFNLPYEEITDTQIDFRANRITSYLNLINGLIEEKIDKMISEVTTDKESIKKYFNGLPNKSKLKEDFIQKTKNVFNHKDLFAWIKENLVVGSVDVNIMTKVDKENYHEKEALPIEYNDAHAAIRGFANSDLNSSVVLSAGMNPRLYTYLANFEDFYPSAEGVIKKKIVLKVSDYRSALIQGKFLAKKGIWVSEYRIESGLNCGGHAFATNGLLIGPILEEFSTKREELRASTFSVLEQTLTQMEKPVPNEVLDMQITAQGGVGTNEEHNLLLQHYGMDSVGWGSPFLLVPEATNVDDETLKKLEQAKEEDLYLSNASPLGVPYNNLRGNTKDDERMTYIEKGRPGSACPKKILALNKEFKAEGLCTASRHYQHLKIKELDDQQLSKEEYKFAYDKIVEKSCICVGLGTSALLLNNIDTKKEKNGVAICPGPNTAYFSKTVSLESMTNHIYGRQNIIERSDRPHMFVKEFTLYLNYLKEQIEETKLQVNKSSIKYLQTFANNLTESSNYYLNLIKNQKQAFKKSLEKMESDLLDQCNALRGLQLQISSISI